MPDIDGVRIDHLVCPTCQESYRLPLEVTVENAYEDFVVGHHQSILSHPVTKWTHYIACPNGHKWTIKQVTRRLNHPDSLLLDRYIGDL